MYKGNFTKLGFSITSTNLDNAADTARPSTDGEGRSPSWLDDNVM